MTAIQQIDFNVDALKAVLWQYDQAPNLQSLLTSKQEWYNVNQTAFWNDWYRDVFDLRTANDFGLQVWAIILGQPLFLNSAPDNKPTWGFGDYYVNFERGNFASSTGSSYHVGTEAARALLRLRYYQLTGSGTVPEINRILADVFSDYGLAYVIDGYDMTLTYVFTFPLTSDLYYLFNNFDILPRPAGVAISYIVLLNESWGFDEYHENFDNGNFSEL